MCELLHPSPPRGYSAAAVVFDDFLLFATQNREKEIECGSRVSCFISVEFLNIIRGGHA
jgi:hypothetical protein